MKRDFSEVALRRGESPPNPAHWAPYEMAINGLAATAVSFVIVGVLMGALPYATWSAIAGTTIWCKFFASFGLGRHAHLPAGRKTTTP